MGAAGAPEGGRAARRPACASEAGPVISLKEEETFAQERSLCALCLDGFLNRIQMSGRRRGALVWVCARVCAEGGRASR